MRKRLVLSLLLVSIAMATLVAPVCAMELWDPHLRGVNEGLAAGALPPKGLYFINDSYWATYQLYDGHGNSIKGTDLNAYVDVPILVWVPGCKFLGADYGVAVAQPFDFTSFEGLEDHWGTFNTVLVPGILSWALPYDFHIAGSFAVYADDATSAPRLKGQNYIPNGNGFWTFEPGIGVSWLHDGWNISADFHIDFSTENNDTHYQSGNEIWVDYTLTKTIGKWTFGAGAYQENQISDDTKDGKNVLNKTFTNFGAGPIVGYNFGPVIATASYNWGIITHNDVGGDWFNLRFVIPIPLCGM